MKSFLLLSAGIVCMLLSHAQTYNPSMDELRPTAPQNFTFTKHTELPASSYTGQANISVPLVDISQDGFTLPLMLSYNSSGGVRMNQEASWVGLGWDLSFGSIVQTIMDGDDLDTSLERLRPDYYNVPFATEYTYMYNYPNVSLNPGFTSTVPIVPVELSFGGRVSTDYRFPLNGNATTQNLAFFDTHALFDSEPDIFVANINGKSVRFKLNWQTGNYVVLNEAGYDIYHLSDSAFKVMDPDGIAYYFEKKIRTTNFTFGLGIFGASSSSDQKSATTWLLTRVVTQAQRVITIDYAISAAVNNYPSYSYKWQKPVLTGQGAYAPGALKGFMGANLNTVNGYLNKMKSVQTSYNYYPTAVTFSDGQVKFILSGRNDIASGQKLDSILLISDNVKKSYAFQYSYFDTLPLSVDSGERLAYGALRLRLDRVVMSDSGLYNFSYDATAFPQKNSCAQDLWGYFNGQYGNRSLVPNPKQFKMADWGDNGENHSSRLPYTQMGILKKIVYPTGGSINLEYESNQFDNYWVPDYADTNNVISNGYGLRIKRVVLRAADGIQSKLMNYVYYGGKAIIRNQFFRSYINTSLFFGSATVTGTQKTYTINEATTTDGFTSSPLSSINGVGYDSVAQYMSDSLGGTIGKTVTWFANTPDRTMIIQGIAMQQLSVPAIKSYYGSPENGSKLAVYTYDIFGRLIKKELDSYTNQASAYDYGVRLGGSWVLAYYVPILYDYPFYVGQRLLGFYPIFDFKSRLTDSKTVEYNVANGDSLVSRQSYSYNDDGLVASKITSGPSGSETEEYLYNNAALGGSVGGDAQAAHRFSDLAIVSNTKNGSTLYRQKINTYKKIGVNKFVVDKVSDITYNYDGSSPDTAYTYYPLYDTVSCIALQKKVKGTLVNYLLDYNHNQKVMTTVNSHLFLNTFRYENMGYNSFETNQNSRWSYNQASVQSSLPAYTGSKYYYLSNNLSLSGLTADGSGNLFVSYWSRSGGYTVNGSAPNAIGRTVNGWSLYLHIISPSATISFTGTGYIDEVRIAPNFSLIETMTWQPLVGITSACDMNNNVTGYEYDRFYRLRAIRDEEWNVVKAFEYNYLGRFKSVRKSQFFTRSCSSGYISDTIEYVVPYGKYYSNINQQKADSLALADIAANGQNYANSNAVCRYNCAGCTGEGKACINGGCRTGEKQYTTSEYYAAGNVYRCYYRYFFAEDGSYSQIYVETSASPCPTND